MDGWNGDVYEIIKEKNNCIYRTSCYLREFDSWYAST